MNLFFGSFSIILSIVSSISLLIKSEDFAFSILLKYFLDHIPLFSKSGKSIINVSKGFSSLDIAALLTLSSNNILSHKPTGFSSLSINAYSLFENSEPYILCL